MKCNTRGAGVAAGGCGGAHATKKTNGTKTAARGIFAFQPNKYVLSRLNTAVVVVIPAWIIVVAGAGGGAKSRLAGELSVEQRQKLVLAMLEDVLDICTRAHLAGILAVVDTAAARSVVERCGAIALDDPGNGDMNAAAAIGIEAACERGAKIAILLPGDLPLITTDDFVSLIEAAGSERRAVVIGASHDGQGTNALLLRPPDVITPSFGPPSLDRHVQAGLTAGALTVVRTNLGLA